MPRWLAYSLLAFFLACQLVGTVCQILSGAANVKYLQSDAAGTPPPYPGQPAWQPPAPDKDEPPAKRRLLRPNK